MRGKIQWKKCLIWIAGILAVIVFMAAMILALLHVDILFLFFAKPDGSRIKSYMEKEYERDFEIVEEFTYISYTDGEVETQKELKCPAVILQDKENQSVSFLAYAYPFETGDWVYRDNFQQKVLIDCIKQEQLEIINEDECLDTQSSCYPRLVLSNTEETAQKLKNMVVSYNDICRSGDGYAAFQVEGSLYAYQVEGQNINDAWLEETSPFCYDTPIEKYQAFLEELEQGENES